jgi:tRNA pseudouridine55 synthase
MDSGFLLIDKPAGLTSHDVVDRLRQITGVKKVGHAGTLDPFATGLLIVGIGRLATRQLNRFLKLDKGYEAILKLGAVSDTFDRDGRISIKQQVINIKRVQIEDILTKFRGEIEQVPPMFSAKKIAGKKLYELARQGKEVERPAVKVKIDELSIMNYEANNQLLTLKCKVSSGTYIRALAHGIGQALPSTAHGSDGAGAYLEELCRTSIGDFELTEAAQLKELNEENWPQYLRDLSNE